MRVLLVDNHDSYTFNVSQLLARVLGEEPRVLRNDDPAWADFDPASVDAVVISPGPGRPQTPRDLGRVPELLEYTHLPVLGVCLGHQAIAHLAGADVVSAPRPRHGHLSRVRHTGTGIFAGVPQDFTAVRYHSLAVSEPLPARVRATAWAEDGVVMGLEHRDLPRWGVQFHPESVAGEHGERLVSGFLDLARPHARPRSRPVSEPAAPNPVARAAPLPAPVVAEIDHAVDTEHAFTHLHADAEYAFWLDSSRPEGPARFSFLGSADGPTAEVLTYDVGDGRVRVRDGRGEHTEPGTVFEALERRTGAAPRPHGLPFDFVGGYVGYLGYELKADTGGARTHTAATPDAVWLRCDRFVAVDHQADRTYVVCADGGVDAHSWVADTRTALLDLPEPPAPAPPGPPVDLSALLERPHGGYVDDVKACLAHLTQGESYEICLTNRVRLDDRGDDLDFYRRLREANPAPYAAFLRLGEVTVLSASPERFLRVDAAREAESRPIKGTAPRHADPATDARVAEDLRTGAKTRAENLMIVDLLRNDLGRVCRVGSVEVPSFMFTESYATVHQLVSTVRGRLRPEVSTMAAVRACFPGGSMTGAPKLRTMEIIDRLESSARGVYSGALGYVSHTGEADLSIVIRTAVRHRGTLTLGAGGAIVLDSDPQEEYEEMLLKAAVPVRGH
ncbi:aminodeoxychorismate synthase component I [Nocardiopsis sp. MG754419]|uniref:aminodeoxychorismate synthase component I n=1 Tax=Nocardiopsis sp. MG754419 TaxID=2259865 RepID=UPI001BAB6133|nr:aminodeoxychorismate synthase component I [Nocardiopsis sp. MG754419]MBR8744207.1 aminodeoxychorismate synthase component I [Nocardiopsis sp. MG754419]